MVVENVNTACSKAYRLFSKQNILSDFEAVLKQSNLVTRLSLVNIDFSTFCGFETLALAVQTNSGRATPVWANCLTYPLTEVGSQNKFVLEEIEKFGEVLGFFPGFVFDRGFWIPELMKFMLERKISFYLRIKQGTHLEWRSGKKMKALNIGKHTKDATITLFEHQMRLVISPLPNQKKTKQATKETKETKSKTKPERWYILTNDFASGREKVLDIYAHRFEIEETFKDLKHICDLKKLFIKHKLTFKILLMFVSLSFWLAFWCHLTNQLNNIQVNLHKKRSYFRVFWEQLQREVRLKIFSG